ncbi:histidine phosphatase family protein [uncultured Clostridium sp.]|uniref:histidine phosphatase family protein n=1 Tax=uncultured Clostridium sp. TaxID=59620 RepID=UPI0028E7DFF5|nr:histidine phosphatase family protein [uncultured Clostridium sp.]
MITNLYLTRHGETLWNTQGRMQGWKDSPLTDKGALQAQLLGKKLKDLDIDIIYSSPIGRASCTAEILKGNKNILIEFDDRLKEINMGKWEGMLREDIEDIYKEELHNFWNTPQLYKPIEGETFNEVIDRTTSFIEEIVNKHKGKNILVVTHTIALRSMLAYIENKDLGEFWDDIFIHPTSLTVVKIGDSAKEVMLKADTSHFNGEL